MAKIKKVKRHEVTLNVKEIINMACEKYDLSPDKADKIWFRCHSQPLTQTTPGKYSKDIFEFSLEYT